MNEVARSPEEISGLEARLAEAEETLRAIYHGEVDALLVKGPQGDQVFTLQGAERPYRLLVEAMNEAALTLGPDGTILYANARLAEIARRPLTEVLGANWTLVIRPTERESFQLLLERADLGGKGEYTLVTGDGQFVPVHVSVRAMSQEGVEAFAVLMTDIRARKMAEDALRQAKEELEVRAAKLHETLSELESFSYSIAHDMRAPLRAMQGFANLLLEDCGEQVGALGRDYIRRIVASAGRLDRLIQDVLHYSRVVKTELRLEPVPVQKLVQEIIESYPSLQPAQAQIKIIPPLPPVLANPAALTQCISNLLGNAVKFVAPGTVPEVTVSAESRGDWVRLWFKDRGIGIEKDAQERIFQIFQRLNRSDEYEGTGIGLAIVRKAVERMGGQVGVESEPGQGSRFWIELRPASSDEK